MAGPVVNHPPADLHSRRPRRECSHWYNRITHEARLCLPHGLEAALLGVLRVCHAFADFMFVLQVHRHACHKVLLVEYQLLIPEYFTTSMRDTKRAVCL